MSTLMKSCTASLLLAVSFAASAADTPAVDGQVAVRDAATGQLRTPTAAEMKALQASGVQLAAATKTGKGQPLGTKTHHHANGATGARLTNEFLSASVIVRQPDGRLVEYCLQSADAAADTAAADRALPTE